MEPKTQIAIVEDELEVREHLAELINAQPDFECLWTYKNPDDAIAFLPQKDVQIIIMDIQLHHKKDGIQVIRELKPVFDDKFLADGTKPQTKFIMNTIWDTRDKLFESLRAGASGYIIKNDPVDKIIEALRDVHNGGAPISPAIARYLIELFPTLPDTSIEFASLTPTENKVLKLIARGLSNNRIAEELGGPKVGVVKIHCHHIYEKLHVRNRTEAAAVYLAKQKQP
jgi:two-component system, NarL family, response regulator LiaR